MTEKMTEKMHKHLAQGVPEALNKAWADYVAFAANKNYTNDKDEMDSVLYKKYQEGCKSAISHVEKIISLGQTVEEKLPIDSQERENLSESIRIAMEQVSRFREAEARRGDE